MQDPASGCEARNTLRAGQKAGVDKAESKSMTLPGNWVEKTPESMKFKEIIIICFFVIDSLRALSQGANNT